MASLVINRDSLDLRDELGELRMLVGARDEEEGGDGAHGAAFQLVLLLVLLLYAVGFHLGTITVILILKKEKKGGLSRGNRRTILLAP